MVVWGPKDEKERVTQQAEKGVPAEGLACRCQEWGISMGGSWSAAEKARP